MTRKYYYSTVRHQEYTMFSFFSMQDGKLNIGQSLAVPHERVPQERIALERNGWKPNSYRYVNGRPILETE